MSFGAYELWLTDDYGSRITDRRGETVLDNVLWLSATRTVNGIGSFTLQLPPSFDTDLIQPDRMVQVWRAPEGGRLGLWRVYFVRRWRYETMGSSEHFTLYGPDVNDVLRRRIVVGFAGSTEAVKDDYADDMMKEFVTESMSDVVAPVPTSGTRAWADLAVAGDLSGGPTLSFDVPFKQLLTPSGGGVLGDIAKAADAEGTPVYFDIVPNTVTGDSINFIFRTYTGQPGMDMTARTVFDQERANLENPFLEYDYTNEVNYVYALGRGAEDNIRWQQPADIPRYSISQWNRCEGTTEAQQQDSDNAVREAGRTALADGLPLRRAGGKPLDVEGTRFGVDWDHGWKVRERYRGAEFDAIIWTTTISVNRKGEEMVRARMEYV
jgi:hypothetical protein